MKLLLLTLLALPLHAQQQPMFVERTVPTHHFADAQNISLQTISALMMAADIAESKRSLAQPGTMELNPLAKSQGALISLKVAGVGAGIGIAYMLHRSGHHKCERVIPLIFGVPSAIAAIHNSTIH